MNTRNLFVSPQRAWVRILANALAVLVVLCLVVFFLGPKNEFGPDTPTAREAAPLHLNELDNWLAQSEAKVSGLKPGTAKGIVWAHADKQATEWAVVYVHGFSASRLETAPVADDVAKALGANVFYTRLTGHGLPGEAMGEATAQDWLADTLEAVRIGKTLGRKVLLISCSTGSTLATWLATSPDAAMVDAHVFISPNFGLKNKASELVNGHWGQRIAYAVTGPNVTYTSDNPRDAQGWTQSYPTKALFPMLALVKKVRDSDLSRFQTPVLTLYSELDETVEPSETKAAVARFGAAQKKLDPVDFSQSKGQHVLAGDIRDPQAVAPMVERILTWVKTLPSP
jgi:alpha-beta hydrolase superfamily lysophospholipase